MLCKVMQTAVTLKTGDHSEPRIDAQIWRDQGSMTGSGGGADRGAYMAIGVDMLIRVRDVRM